MCYTVQGPCVESLINHPVCRPALSIGAEWLLFHRYCLLHVNKRAMVYIVISSSPIIWPSQSYKADPALETSIKMKCSSTCWILKGRWLERVQQGQGQGDWGQLTGQWGGWWSMFAFGWTALLWPGQRNVSLTSAARVTAAASCPLNNELRLTLWTANKLFTSAETR